MEGPSYVHRTVLLAFEVPLNTTPDCILPTKKVLIITGGLMPIILRFFSKTEGHAPNILK